MWLCGNGLWLPSPPPPILLPSFPLFLSPPLSSPLLSCAQVNAEDISGFTRQEVGELLRNAQGRVTLLVSRQEQGGNEDEEEVRGGAMDGVLCGYTCKYEIIEAHYYIVTPCKWILMSICIAGSINQEQLIAEHFDHVGLRQLGTVCK